MWGGTEKCSGTDLRRTGTGGGFGHLVIHILTNLPVEYKRAHTKLEDKLDEDSDPTTLTEHSGCPSADAIAKTLI